MKYSQIFQRAHDLILAEKEHCCCAALYTALGPRITAPDSSYWESQFEKAFNIFAARHKPAGVGKLNLWWPMTSEGRLARLAALLDCRDYFQTLEEE